MTVADEARAIAAAWSPPGAPPSWWLTAATFTAIAEDEVLLGLAAGIPPDRQPALLVSAAIGRLVAERGPAELARFYPRPGLPQPAEEPGFRPALAAFVRAEREALAALCARHRYQMNEVARSLDVLPVLGTIAAEHGRPLALVDLGTGAGFGLYPDRYGYRYRLPGGAVREVGPDEIPLECAVRGAVPPVPAALPRIVARVGVDAEPSDLTDPDTAAWLTACVPPEAAAVTRFAGALALLAAEPPRVVRGNLLDVVEDVVAGLPPEAVVCLVDTYVHVFLGPADLARFDDALARIGRTRDVEWISVDPLVPLGPAADRSVQGLPVPPEWLADNREGGVFGVVGRVSVRAGVRRGTVLGRAHPGAGWLEWCGTG